MSGISNLWCLLV